MKVGVSSPITFGKLILPNDNTLAHANVTKSHLALALNAVQSQRKILEKARHDTFTLTVTGKAKDGEGARGMTKRPPIYPVFSINYQLANNTQGQLNGAQPEDDITDQIKSLFDQAINLLSVGTS